MDARFLKAKFDAGLGWEDYLATDPARAANWRRVYDRARLDDGERARAAGFTRRINALTLSGTWCGDCVQQLPLLERIAEAGPALVVRYLDRDEHLDLARQVMINAGLRVPTVIFAAEDFEPVSVLGDRSLHRYRAVAAKKLGGACPLPGAPVDEDELRATLRDWLDEVERVHLLLRLSTRLRQKHGD